MRRHAKDIGEQTVTFALKVSASHKKALESLKGPNDTWDRVAARIIFKMADPAEREASMLQTFWDEMKQAIPRLYAYFNLFRAIADDSLKMNEKESQDYIQYYIAHRAAWKRKKLQDPSATQILDTKVEA